MALEKEQKVKILTGEDLSAFKLDLEAEDEEEESNEDE